MIDFENFKVNCSQIGHLMGNAKGNIPPTKSQITKLFGFLGRDYGELSESMKHTAREILTKAILYDPKHPSGTILSEMVLIYAYEMYGKGKISKGNDSPHQLEKANMAEPAAIQFLSRMDGVEYRKNEELFESKYLKGIPDIICRGEKEKVTKIIEVKTSYDLPSFILSMVQPEKMSNFYETMGYMDILNCKQAEIVHVLVDMPEKIAQFEEKRLQERYEMLELDENIARSRIVSRLSDMEYSGIPDELKIFRRPVVYNKYTMYSVRNRAKLARKWLQEVIHEPFIKNLVNLNQTEVDQEDNV